VSVFDTKYLPRILSLFFCLGLLLLTSCSDSGEVARPVSPAPTMPKGIPVQVSIDPDSQAGTLDERYIGFAFDTAQFSGGYWWSWGAGGPEPEPVPDLESQKFRRLVSYLAPSRMRIGGTDADAAYFCPEEGECELPPQYRNVFIDAENERPGVLTHEVIRRAADFAEAVGARVMFCVNAGPGPRYPQTGRWIPDNARALIRYARSLPNGHVFDTWELGNEVNIMFNAFHMPILLTWLPYASDLATFRAVVDEEAPGCRVASPGCFFVPYASLRDLNFTLDLLRVARDIIDVVTWHLYATQSERCPDAFSPAPASKEALFDESFVFMHRNFARYVASAAADLPVMNGESASAQCGGQAGVSDTLLDALWFADWIGIMAEEGSSSIVRQSIVGGDYGLLDPDTLDPRPSFLAYVMFRRTVERYRLKTLSDRSMVKAHGFCTAGGDGRVTAVLSNPSDEGLAVEISLDGTEVVRAMQWKVGSDGDLTATRASIEGRLAGQDGTIPDPPGTQVYLEKGKAYAKVDPNSLVFVVLEPSHTEPVCYRGG
jgi:heparanase